MSCVGLDACTTREYAAALNASGLCGADDWRLPIVWELRSIVDYGNNLPPMDRDYFPNVLWTNAAHYWTSNARANAPQSAWKVSFSHLFGDTASRLKNLTGRVRLVRAEPQP